MPGLRACQVGLPRPSFEGNSVTTRLHPSGREARHMSQVWPSGHTPPVQTAGRWQEIRPPRPYHAIGAQRAAWEMPQVPTMGSSGRDG